MQLDGATNKLNLQKSQSNAATIHTINVVMSFAPGEYDLPENKKFIKSLLNSTSKITGNKVTVTAYVKTENISKEIEIESGENYVVRKIPDHGHNEFSYFYHMAKHYGQLADAEIFAKTNKVKVNDIVSMIKTARTGQYPYDANPWVTCRTIVAFYCDQRWKDHEMFDRVCSEKMAENVPMELHNFKGLVVIQQHGLPYKDLLGEVRPGRPPLVWSGFFEGHFSVHSALIRKYPQTFYDKIISDMMHQHPPTHDSMFVEFVPALFSQEYEDVSPVWAVPPSYANYPCVGRKEQK